MLDYLEGILTGAVIVAAIWWRDETVSQIKLIELAKDNTPFILAGIWYKLVPYHDKK